MAPPLFIIDSLKSIPIPIYQPFLCASKAVLTIFNTALFPLWL